MTKPLEILITAKLNEGISEDKIRKQLDMISKNLNVNLGVDNKQIDKITMQVKELQRQLSGEKVQLVTQEDLKNGKKFHRDIESIVNEFKHLGTIKIDRVFNPITGELNKLNAEIKHTDGLIQKLGFQKAELQGIHGIEDGFLLTSDKLIDKSHEAQKKLNQTQAESVNKTIDQNKALEKQLQLYKQNSDIQARTLLSTHSKTVDTKALADYQKQVKDLRVDTPDLSHKMRELSLTFRDVSGSARDASRSSMTVMDAFRTAMIKFPVWMGATTVFFGSFRLLTDSISIITEVDTKITDLKKVMDEDTNFENVMNNANASAEKFGKTLRDTLDAYTEFTRQGYGEEDVATMGDAALVASNVGEISAGKAAEYLTSTMIQLKLETKDAMGVIDSWNSVANQNATTVEKLAAGHAKAGSTASAWGLDLHELNAVLGTVTAATKQSGKHYMPLILVMI